eukprot:2919335-Rhodomonas_salina.2
MCTHIDTPGGRALARAEADTFPTNGRPPSTQPRPEYTLPQGPCTQSRGPGSHAARMRRGLQDWIAAGRSDRRRQRSHAPALRSQ